MSSHFEMVSQVAENIEESLSEDINIPHLAADLGLSPWHFQRLFKSIVGDSLGNYLRGRRLTKGASLLLDTNFDIIQIASEVGFNSHEAFTRSFKKQFELTPKQFREKKPKFLQTRKPKLNRELQDFIFSGISGEPEIVEMPKLNLSGYDTQIPSPFFASETMCQGIYNAWMKLIAERESDYPQDFIGITISPSGNYIEEEMQFLASEVLKSSENKPGRETLILPKQKVAMFKIHIDLNEDNVGKTIDYIYGYWLPNSKFSRGSGHDYEYFKGVVDFSKFDEFDYYYVIPVL